MSEAEAMDRTDDPNTILEREEDRLCECGAAGSGEGHCDWCKAKKFDHIPGHMDAAQAVKWLRLDRAASTTKEG